ncbi:MAG: hypothetical protein HY744_33105 [Deltaproteobacteria bacterium]|nr:hypothetical protein [Deltaproteobacteria bacterium]
MAGIALILTAPAEAGEQVAGQSGLRLRATLGPGGGGPGYRALPQEPGIKRPRWLVFFAAHAQGPCAAPPPPPPVPASAAEPSPTAGRDELVARPAAE